MSQLVPIRLEKSDETIFVQVDDVQAQPTTGAGPPPPGSPAPSRSSAVLGRAIDAGAGGVTFESALRKVKPAIESVVEILRTLSPESFDLEFGLGFNGDVNLFLAKGGADVNFKVTIHWTQASGYSS